MLDNNNECPPDLDELRKAKIIDKPAKDSWGQKLLYKCPGDNNKDGVDISSKGPDKQEGTEDDLDNWSENVEEE